MPAVEADQVRRTIRGKRSADELGLMPLTSIVQANAGQPHTRGKSQFAATPCEAVQGLDVQNVESNSNVIIRAQQIGITVTIVPVAHLAIEVSDAAQSDSEPRRELVILAYFTDRVLRDLRP